MHINAYKFKKTLAFLNQAADNEGGVVHPQYTSVYYETQSQTKHFTE
jgi:hypothetical protein